MAQYKATINIERALWDDFRAYCNNYETTASELIREMIRARLGRTEDGEKYLPSWEKKLEEQRSIVADHGHELEQIDKRLYQLEQLLQRFSYLSKETDKETEKGTETDKETETNKETEVDKRFQKMISKYPLDQKFPNTLVAEIEGLSASMISAYKTRRRTPKDETFFDRWQLDKKRKDWIAIRKNEKTNDVENKS